MGLFTRQRFVWNEPWFFQQRNRTVRAWVLFILFLAVCSGVLFAVLLWGGKPGNGIGIFEATGLSLGLAASIWWILDGSETRRKGELHSDRIVIGGDMGKYSSATTYLLADISRAEILLPEQSPWTHPVLYFFHKGAEQVIGIEKSLQLSRFAQALHDAGIQVSLLGWTPNQQNEFSKVFSWLRSSSSATPTARIEPLAPTEPKMMNASGILLAIFQQCWAIGVVLIIIIAAAYYAYQNWNQLGLIEFALVFTVPLFSLYVAGTYTDRYASAATSQGLVRMAKDQIRKRSASWVDVDQPGLIPVEVFERPQFDQSIQKIREMGFVQVDTQRSCLFFEGKGERWTLPADSLISVVIEEVQVGTAGQSTFGALNYYVVVRFLTANGEQEFGFRYGDRDFGEVTDAKRAAGNIRLFEEFDPLLPVAA